MQSWASLGLPHPRGSRRETGPHRKRSPRSDSVSLAGQEAIRVDLPPRIMKTFHCDNCNAPVYFENIRCLGCGSTLGIMPETYEVRSVKTGPNGQALGRNGKSYRFCKNSVEYASCNQLVDGGENSPYCLSCRFTEITPDLAFEVNRELWAEMERAKRRLLFSLFQLGIQPLPKSADAVKGLAFRFLVDNVQPVITGHENGVITISLAEADKATRETRRQQLGESYRTLLGHFRHEIGHYFWDRLISDGGKIQEFRGIFGDESVPYEGALRSHYAKAPDNSWRTGFISRYAAAHPWEDWAETFAHFLHMRDVLETARAVGLIETDGGGDFRRSMELWLATSFRLNQLGRSIGSGDLYPFVLTDRVIEKMEFIHGVIASSASIN